MRRSHVSAQRCVVWKSSAIHSVLIGLRRWSLSGFTPNCGLSKVLFMPGDILLYWTFMRFRSLSADQAATQTNWLSRPTMGQDDASEASGSWMCMRV